MAFAIPRSLLARVPDRRALYVAMASVPWLILALADRIPLLSLLCVAPSAELLARLRIESLFAFDSSTIVAQAAAWLVMIAAMASPLVYPLAHYVMVRSRRDDRVPAVIAFLSGYIAVWMMALILATSWLLCLALSLPPSAIAPAAFAAAALWQLCPIKTWALRRCHRTWPISVDGWTAAGSCLLLGMRHGTYCSIACLPMMTASMVGTPHVLAMLVVWAIAVGERFSLRPSRAAPVVLLALMGMVSAV